MTNATWQPVGKPVRIQAAPDVLWTLVLDYVPPNRLLRLSVRKIAGADGAANATPTWCVTSTQSVNADGMPCPSPAKTTAVLLGSAPCGALIAKIGGSSADLPDMVGTSGPWPNKKVFAVGSTCVVSIGKEEGGPLYLTMNDSPDAFKDHSGFLEVVIEECAF